MIYSGSSYSVLLVSASEAFSRSVEPLLPPSRFYPVTSVADLRSARDCGASDLVLVNAPLPSGDAEAFCLRCAEGTDAAVLLLVPQDQLEAAENRLLPAGIMTLGKPISSAALSQALRNMCVLRERLRSREETHHSVEETIEELKLLNRAKWLLITCLNMTEDEAHRYIGRLAMQQKRPRRDIAESIIRTYSQ